MYNVYNNNLFYLVSIHSFNIFNIGAFKLFDIWIFFLKVMQ